MQYCTFSVFRKLRHWLNSWYKRRARFFSGIATMEWDLTREERDLWVGFRRGKVGVKGMVNQLALREI